MNYGYGTPVLIFAYPLSNYLIALSNSLLNNFELVYKILIGSAFILSGITFFLYSQTLFPKRVASGSAILYMFLPYHFLNLFVRGHLGELLALSIAPLVLYFIEKNIRGKTIINIICGSFFYALLIISHNILALLFTVIYIFHIITFSKKINDTWKNLTILIGGLLLSAYFWLPALYEGKYINSKLFLGNYFVDHFIKIENLIYAPWGFGPNINDVGGLAPQIGIIPALLVGVSLFGLKFKKIRKQI